MDNFLSYLFPTLKFGAIFLSAFSGSLALLVNYKEDGKITKWGRIALCGVIISFLISASTQALEIQRAKKASLAEERKTQDMLYQISRGIYSINPSNISFDATAKISCSNKYLSAYNSRVGAVLSTYILHPQTKLPAGVYAIPVYNEKGEKETPFSFIITPGSALYPDSLKEQGVYGLIGQLALDIRIKKPAGDTSGGGEPNLAFSTELKSPQLEYNLADSTIILDVEGLHGKLEDYAWRNGGGIESLLDLSSATISFALSDFQIDNLDDEGVEAAKAVKFQLFSLNAANRKFSYLTLCSEKKDWPGYHVQLPQDVQQTHLNLECGKNSE